MVVVNVGYIPVVELFFLEHENLFFLKYHKDTLGNSFITLKGYIFVLLCRQKTASQNIIYFLYGILKYP